MTNRSSRPPQPQETLVAALQRSFVEGSPWPIDRAALSALLDMGLSDSQIATYFATRSEQVAALRDAYGLRHSACS